MWAVRARHTRAEFMAVIHTLLRLAAVVSVNAQVMPSCSDVDSNGHVEIPSGVTSIPDVSTNARRQMRPLSQLHTGTTQPWDRYCLENTS